MPLPTPLNLFVRFVLLNERGCILRDSGFAVSRSLVKQFFQFLECAFKDADLADVKAVDGQLYTIVRPSGSTSVFFKLAAAEGEDDVGIVVGGSDQAVSPDDYKLYSHISHGTGAGQLVYRDCSVEATSITNTTIYIDIIRSFKNDSGDDVVVKEVGIYAKAYESGGSVKSFLLARDVYLETIPPGAIWTVTYRLKTTA